jgi:flagellin-like protein
MKSFRKTRKALSPVVASIILIAVTVAVSIAVAAWMGALVVAQMRTEQLKITSVAFSEDSITVIAHNFGTRGVLIDEVWVNNSPIPTEDVSYDASQSVPENGEVTITISYTGLVSGGNYEVKIQTAQGNYFMCNAIA